MCGIAGYALRRGAAREETVRAMCAQIRHRGPDDEGVHIDGGCGIGMRRLSIIDLSTGHQPVANEDGSVWIVFNGEIYNYQELRAGSDRARPHASAPTATPKPSFISTKKRAPGCLQHLRGMFAFAHLGLTAAQNSAGARPLRQEAAVLLGDARRALLRERVEMSARGRRSARRGSRRPAALLPVRLHSRPVHGVSRCAQAHAGLLAGIQHGWLCAPGPLLAHARVPAGRGARASEKRKRASGCGKASTKPCACA